MHSSIRRSSIQEPYVGSGCKASHPVKFRGPSPGQPDGLEMSERRQQAAGAGGSIDDALLRIGGAALFAWFVLGRINTILSSVPQPATPPDRETPDAT